MYQVTIKPEWIIRPPGGESLPRRLVELLVKVDELGSLASACKATGVSYRYAWELLRQGESLFGEPLIVMKRGKGSTLTVLGEKLVWADRRVFARLSPLLASLASELSAEIEKARSHVPGLLRIHASHGFSIQLLHEFLAAANLPHELTYRSSLEAVASLHNSSCDVAGFHVPVGEFEAPVLKHYGEWLKVRSRRIISIVTRRQGLIVARGNPKDIYRLEDLARPDVKFINRQPGSGTRLLLDLLLQKENIDPRRIAGYEQCEYTHAAVAAFVASGMADAGYGVETPARQFKLDFIPIQTERYFLLCDEKSLETPSMKTLLRVLRSTRYKAAVNALRGYRVQKSGTVSDLQAVFGASLERFRSAPVQRAPSKMQSHTSKGARK